MKLKGVVVDNMSKEEKDKKEKTLNRMEETREKDDKRLRHKIIETINGLEYDERVLLLKRDELEKALKSTKKRLERVKGAIIVLKKQLE